MKKKVLLVLMMAGLIFVGPAQSAVNGRKIIVGNERTVQELVSKWAINPSDCVNLVARPSRITGRRPVYLRCSSMVIPGETLYMIASRMKSGSKPTSPKIQPKIQPVLQTQNSSNYSFFKINKGRNVLAGNLALKETGDSRSCLSWFKMKDGAWIPVTKRTLLNRGDLIRISKGKKTTTVRSAPSKQEELVSRKLPTTGFKQNIFKTIDGAGWASWQRNLHSGTDRKGFGYGGKIEAKIYSLKVGNQIIEIGPLAKINIGEVTVNGKTYKYDQRGIGILGETTVNFRTLRGELLLSTQTTDGPTDSQETISGHVGLSVEDDRVRRNGGRFLTAYRAALTHRQPLSKKGGDYDERVTELTGRYALVDVPITENNLLALEAHGVFGFSAGKDSFYGGIGPGAALINKGSELARLTLLPVEYFSNKDASVLKVLVYVNIDGTLRAIQAAGVREVHDSNVEKARKNNSNPSVPIN